MIGDFKDAKYKARYAAKGIPFAGKVGVKVNDCKTADEVIKKAGLDFTVAKCQLAAKMNMLTDDRQRDDNVFANIVNGLEFVDVPNCYATYRTDCNIPLGMVKSRYEPVQNSQAFNFFDSCIGDNIKWESAGYFGYGERIFVTAKLDKTISIGGKDDVDHYLVFTNSHDGGSPVRMMITPIRMWCLNLLNAAMTSAEAYVSFRHNTGVNEKIISANELLGLTYQKISAEEEMYNHLFNKKLSDDEIKTYICRTVLSEKEMLDVVHGKLIDGLLKRDNVSFEEAGISKQKLNMLVGAWEYTNEGLGQEIIAGTAWAAYNGINGYLNNVKDFTDSKKRLDSLAFGTDYNLSQKALELAIAI